MIVLYKKYPFYQQKHTTISLVKLMSRSCLVVSVSRHSATGPVCSDPGRPADGTQIATSYEIGKTVTFTCDRPGFVPEPSSLTCESKDNGARAAWNDTHPSHCVGKFLFEPVS